MRGRSLALLEVAGHCEECPLVGGHRGTGSLYPPNCTESGRAWMTERPELHDKGGLSAQHLTETQQGQALNSATPQTRSPPSENSTSSGALPSWRRRLEHDPHGLCALVAGSTLPPGGFREAASTPGVCWGRQQNNPKPLSLNPTPGVSTARVRPVKGADIPVEGAARQGPGLRLKCVYQ